MKHSKIYAVTLALIWSCGAVANNNGGGATTVGDGGFGVVCPRAGESSTVELLDIFEARALGKPSEFRLGGESVDLETKVAVGLLRVKRRLILDSHQVASLDEAAKWLLRQPFDPWKRGYGEYWAYFLKTKNPSVNRRVYEEIERRGCHVQAIVVRPDPSTVASARAYDSICKANIASNRYCFLTDSDLYRKLDKDTKACLIIHESLRLIQKEKLAGDEKALRSLTHRICTGT